MSHCRVCLEKPPEITALGIPRHGEVQPFDDYLLPNHWCFHIYSYHAILELDGVPFSIRPGYASIVPAGTRMVYRYAGPSEHVYFHFVPKGDRVPVDVPLVLDLGAAYEAMDHRARKAVGRSMLDSSYPVATLWALLWEIADVWTDSRVERAALRRPLVTTAIKHIEQRLCEPLSIARLSDEIGVSYGYLTRLFNASFGVSVQEYIRSRRAEQALHLLRSTTLPIKVVARTVGVPNLQQFNRMMHKTKGASPRELRFLGVSLQPVAAPAETTAGKRD